MGERLNLTIHQIGALRSVATHIAHAGNPVHPELVDFACRHGYEVAYDGLTVHRRLAQAQAAVVALNERKQGRERFTAVEPLIHRP